MPKKNIVDPKKQSFGSTASFRTGTFPGPGITPTMQGNPIIGCGSTKTTPRLKKPLNQASPPSKEAHQNYLQHCEIDLIQPEMNPQGILNNNDDIIMIKSPVMASSTNKLQTTQSTTNLHNN